MIVRSTIEEGEIVEFSWSGTVALDKISDLIARKYPSIEKNVLWNFEQTDACGINRGDMRQIAKAAKEHARHEKTAFVGLTNAVFASLRMYEAHAEMTCVPTCTRVFKSREEAIQWLRTGESAPERV